MAAALLFFLFFSSVSAQRRTSHIITAGSSLTPTANSTWFSPSGLYAFGFFPHKNAYAVGIFLAGIDNTVVWTANTDNPTVPNDAVLQLTRDGRFVLQQKGQQDVPIANPSATITSASMLDNGNFVLYNNNGSTIIWQSFDYPTNTLLGGQRLLPGHDLFSSASNDDYTRGFFRLVMQLDGNLVAYPATIAGSILQPRDAYYATNTDGSGNNVSLNLEPNGHLYLLNGSSILTNLTQGYPPVGNSTTIYLMRFDVDGIFHVYSHPSTREGNWSIPWSPGLNKCDVKGICGFNSFCFPIDDDAGCKCLPGFESIQPGNRTAGCARIFGEVSCSNNNSKVQFVIREEANMLWDDYVYDALDSISEDGCIKACLDDCNCEAAFYKDSQCRKQRTPLRYGRRVQGESNRALVKVGVPTSQPDAFGVPNNSTKESSKKQFRSDILGISIALFSAAVLIAAISAIYVHRKRRAYEKIAPKGGEVEADKDVAPKAFNYADLAQATNDFVEEIGKGASGTVFKGILPSSQRVIAVKRLEKECGGEKEFQTEMKTIGKTYHRNLVRLLGYCLNGPNRLLVFEYMSNGSLADVLFNPDKRLRWEDRINIARDIARGVLYLHEECETQIIHCDIKPQNILLDEQGCAKISDFGLAKLLNHDQTNTYTGIRGTRGYVAPEWHRGQAVTVKADVYSFGIVLLEIVCCRRSIDWNLSEDEAVLEDWVYDCYEARELGNLVENEAVDKRKLERVVKIGLWCIQNEPSLRPSMKKVLLMLEGTVDIPIPPNPTSFLSSTQ